MGVGGEDAHFSALQVGGAGKGAVRKAVRIAGRGAAFGIAGLFRGIGHAGGYRWRG
jgi:hypothetical protein